MKLPNYDEGFCGTLPLHRINHVQEYGCLIITDLSLTIVQVSENLKKFTDIDHATCIGNSFVSFITKETEVYLRKSLEENKYKKFSFFLSEINNKKVNMLAVVNVQENLLLIELEPSENARPTFNDAYQRMRGIFQAIDNADTWDATLQNAVTELKKLSGFDKVMIYKFDEKWNGNVVAEAMEKGMDSYLGLYFPASDIPKQARELYHKNPYRFIPNSKYTPVQLHPVLNAVTSGFVDMSSCNLRGVAKVHCEYLQNMNVSSSMSTRILKDGQLWGLISCHHRAPFFINYDECLLFELVSNIISSKLATIETSKRVDETKKIQEVKATVVAGLYSGNSFKYGVQNVLEPIMKTLECDGIAYVQGSNYYSLGNAPARSDLSELFTWLQVKNFYTPYISSSLENEFENGKFLSEKASGIVVLPIVNEDNEFIIGFRGEAQQQISWGGDPNNAVRFDADNKSNYHPRNSFATWKQTVKNTSFPFTQLQLDFAMDIHHILLNYRITEFNRK